MCWTRPCSCYPTSCSMPSVCYPLQQSPIGQGVGRLRCERVRHDVGSFDGRRLCASRSGLWVCFLSSGFREGVRGDALKTTCVFPTRLSSLDGTTSLWGSTARLADFLWCLFSRATARTRAFGQDEGATVAQESRDCFLSSDFLRRSSGEVARRLRLRTIGGRQLVLLLFPLLFLLFFLSLSPPPLYYTDLYLIQMYPIHLYPIHLYPIHLYLMALLSDEIAERLVQIY